MPVERVKEASRSFDAGQTDSAESAPRVPRLKLSKKRTQRRSSGTVVPLER